MVREESVKQKRCGLLIVCVDVEIPVVSLPSLPNNVRNGTKPAMVVVVDELVLRFGYFNVD